jgi:hypothetical protein
MNHNPCRKAHALGHTCLSPLSFAAAKVWLHLVIFIVSSPSFGFNAHSPPLFIIRQKQRETVDYQRHIVVTFEGNMGKREIMKE